MNNKAKIALKNFYEAAKLSKEYNKAIKRNERMAIFDSIGKDNEILFIGEAPGKKEAELGIPFVGRSGTALRTALYELGQHDFSVTNVMPIKPVDWNDRLRKPKPTEIEYFRPYLKKFIEELKPKSIVALGKSATEALQLEWKPLKWDGNIYIMYHPAWYVRGNRKLKLDLKRMLIGTKKER